MHITSHRHYTFKNIFLFSYSDGVRNLCKAASSQRSCSLRIRHLLASIILLTPFANCIAQSFFIRNGKKYHQIKKAKQKLAKQRLVKQKIKTKRAKKKVSILSPSSTSSQVSGCSYKIFLPISIPRHQSF